LLERVEYAGKFMIYRIIIVFKRDVASYRYNSKISHEGPIIANT